MASGRALLLLAALVAPLLSGCVGATSDCNASSSASPIDIYINGTPASMGAGAFEVTAIGSKGDAPPLAATAAASGIVIFSGTGGGSETYQVTVTYERSVIYEGTTGFSVSNCGYAVNVDFSSCCSDAGAAASGRVDSGE